MSRYLLVYNRRTGELRHQEFRGAGSADAAIRCRLQEERARTNADVEIVVISADSLDQVKRTHGRYFRSAAKLVQGAIESSQDGAVALA